MMEKKKRNSVSYKTLYLKTLADFEAYIADVEGEKTWYVKLRDRVVNLF